MFKEKIDSIVRLLTSYESLYSIYILLLLLSVFTKIILKLLFCSFILEDKTKF